MRDRKAEVLLGDFKGRTEEICSNTEKLCGELESVLERAFASRSESATVHGSVHEIADSLTAVSAAAEEFSVTMQQVRESTGQSEDNIRSVSESTGELATASSEIAKNAERARSVSGQAVDSVDFTLSQVTSLESVAGEISDVTQVIHDISEQTKILALNATIEAARAAEAGRGFAVVAREVKDLASETRDATAFIRKKVSTIEASISATIGAIKKVASVIEEVSGVVNNIAASAEEQSIATRNIAQNADRASEHFVEITAAIDEGATAMQDVSERIAVAATQGQTVREATRKVSENSTEISQGASVSFAYAIEVIERLKDALAQIETSGMSVREGGFEAGKGLFQFDKRFSVLIDKMDEDHQQIFDYVNEIHASVKTRGNVSDQNRIFGEMVAFTREHFHREEEIMREGKFPGLPEQERQHKELLDTVDGYANALSRGEEINMIAAMSFLNSWLINHILLQDQQYGEFFDRKGIAPA